MRRWRGWWKVANQEHFLTFFCIGLLTLLMLSVLVWSTVGQQDIGADLEFINSEAEILGNEIGGWFRSFFLFAGMVVLFSTSIGIMDYVSRLSASELKVSFFPDSQAITESRIYFTIAWVIAIGGSLILLAGLEAPLVLLIIAASGGGVVMFFYSGAAHPAQHQDPAGAHQAQGLAPGGDVADLAHLRGALDLPGVLPDREQLLGG